MAGRTIQIEAMSLEEARRIAASELGVRDNALNVEVIQKGRTTLFGRKDPWIIKASVSNAAIDDLIADTLRNVESLDGYADFAYTDAGVTVTVYPPKGDGNPVSEKAARDEAERRHITGLDVAALRSAIESMSERPVLVAPPQEEYVVNGSVDVKIAPDLMSASVTVYPPGNGRPVTEEDVRKALYDSGVTIGFDDEAIERAVAMQDPALPVVVARGCPATDGQNARIQYQFDVNPERERPTELANGRVDFYNLNLIQNVKKGDVLAVKIPAEQGVDGFNIRGDRLPARGGRDVQLPVGKGCEVLADGLTIVAAVDGQVTLTGGKKIAVLPVYEVRGDVDLSTGNINFIGNVVIRGSLASGFEIIADGDVTIDGYVDAGTIKAGGNVVIRKGIQGRNKGVIEAGGSVSAMFIENGTLRAGTDVAIAEAIMHSEIVAGGSVVCMGRKGLIVGGRIQARDEVSARVIGAAMGTLTEIEVGIDPALREELIKVAAVQRDVEANLAKTAQAVKILKDIEQAEGRLDPDRKDKLLKLIRSQYHLMGQRDALNAKRRQFEEDMENRLKGRVRAHDLIHPGTRVAIGRSTLHIRDELKHSSLILGPDHAIAVGPYD